MPVSNKNAKPKSLVQKTSILNIGVSGKIIGISEQACFYNLGDLCNNKKTIDIMNNKKNSKRNNNKLKAAWNEDVISKNQLTKIKGGIYGRGD